MFKWDLDELRKAGIGPSLRNYLLMVKGKECRLGSCPLKNACHKLETSHMSNLGEEFVGGLTTSFRCPVIVYDA